MRWFTRCLALAALLPAGCGRGPVAVCPCDPEPGGSTAAVPEVLTVEPDAIRCDALPAWRTPERIGEPPVERPPAGGFEEQTAEFRFPDDAGGVLLRKFLPPRVSLVAVAERATAPRRGSGPVNVEAPTGLPAPTLDVVRLAPLSPRGVAAPKLTTAEPVAVEAAPPVPPTPAEFKVGPKLRAESLNPNLAPELPRLANYVADRAPTDDPTRDQSLSAALAAPIPAREKTVPFARQGIPDPFENRRAVKFTPTSEEPGQPMAATPRVP